MLGQRKGHLSVEILSILVSKYYWSATPSETEVIFIGKLERSPIYAKTREEKEEEEAKFLFNLQEDVGKEKWIL